MSHRVPPVVRQLRGDPGKFSKTDQAKRPPQPRSTSSRPPADVLGPARQIWYRHAAEAIALGTLTQLDRDEFALACRCRALGLAALQRAEAGGDPVTPTELQLLRDSTKIFARFGVGALDRAKLALAPPETPDQWQALIS